MDLDRLLWFGRAVTRAGNKNDPTKCSCRTTHLSGLVKRSFSLVGHRTSIALEEPFWAALLGIAQARGQTLSTLVAAADLAREPGQPLASALRVMALLAKQGE